MHKQCQSKYHRNNDIPISKTCVKPSRLNIFWVLGKFWITIAKFKAIIVPTNAQTSKEKEKQGQEQKRIQANTLFALKKCVYVTGRGVYPSVRLKNSFFRCNIKTNVISGDLFFSLKRCSLGTSDIQGCYSPKRIT